MHCLVTGATGFIGRSLCKHLLCRGDSVLALSKSGEPLSDGTPTVAMDLVQQLPDAEQLEGVDVVFHLAGIAHQRASAEQHHRLNYFATVELAKAAANAGVGRFVYLSSVKAMGAATGEEPRSEAQCELPEDSYGLSKWQAECGLQELVSCGQMTVRILRPALVYGSGAKGNLALLVRWLRMGLPRPPDYGRRSMIGVPDLIDVLCLAAEHEQAASDTWIVCDGRQYSTRALYDALRLADGKGTGLAWLPAWVWRLVCATADVLRSAPEPTWKKLFTIDLYSNAALSEATGWQPQYQFSDLAPQVLGKPGSDAP